MFSPCVAEIRGARGRGARGGGGGSPRPRTNGCFSGCNFSLRFGCRPTQRPDTRQLQNICRAPKRRTTRTHGEGKIIFTRSARKSIERPAAGWRGPEAGGHGGRPCTGSEGVRRGNRFGHAHRPLITAPRKVSVRHQDSRGGRSNPGGGRSLRIKWRPPCEVRASADCETLVRSASRSVMSYTRLANN